MIEETRQQLIPPQGYTSETIFQREIDQLFSRCWNYAGLADEIPEPGDYQCVQAGRYPLVLVRDNAGTIRAFHNICRHRGTVFLEGSGSSRKGLTCPYHKWYYKLDGRLKSVPRQDALFPDIDKSKLGLLPASVGEFRGLLFVHPEPTPDEDFDTYTAELDAQIGPHDPSQMVKLGQNRFLYPANWKVVVENYLDTYHLFYLHRDSVKMLDHAKFEWSVTGRHILLYEPVHSDYKDWVYKAHGLKADQCVPGADPEVYGGQYHLLFPNFGWAAMAYSWNTFHAIPVAVDKTIVEMTSRVMPSALERMKKSSESTGRFGSIKDRPVTLDDCTSHPLESGESVFEDMWACGQVQKGLMSPAYRVNALARKYESMISVHQRSLMDFMDYGADGVQ